FGPLGLASNTGVLRASGGDTGYLRYDTYARVIDENHAVGYTAGDFITQALPWSRSVRMGGVQASRAFRVRPDLVTMPLPTFAGETAVPTSVDLFVNGYRQQSASVQPGRFVLDNIPVVNGAGQATIVTTDAVGRQISTTLPFYVSATLLKPGLLDFSAEVGALRRNYGLRNFDYGPTAASGVARYGLLRSLTIEGHAEAARGLGMAGLGVAWSPRRMGIITASAAASRTDALSGSQWAVGYEYNTQRFSLAVQHEQRGGSYRDLGDFGTTSGSGARRMDRVIGGMSLGLSGSLSVAYFDGKTLGQPDSRIATASYQRGLGRRATLLATIDHDFERRSTGAQLRIAVPFGRNSVGGGVTYADGRTRTEVDFARSMPSQGGLGVDAGVAVDQRGETFGQGTVTWRNNDVQVQAGAATAAGQSSAWTSATGSIIAMDRSVFTANRVSDAFAVVNTGQRGVGVFYENQRVGATDKRGRLFVPHVISYQNATYAIDALALSADQVADAVKLQ
ncbi:MAG: fimbrial biogenesis outer membrane usher protein, partial [Caulobacteraceae bacterium]